MSATMPFLGLFVYGLFFKILIFFFFAQLFALLGFIGMVIHFFHIFYHWIVMVMFVYIS